MQRELEGPDAMKRYSSREKELVPTLRTHVRSALAPVAPHHAAPERAHQKARPFSQGAKPLNPEALNPFEKFKCFY